MPRRTSTIYTGGSLIARLFDGHPDIASYPMEFNFPINRDLYPIFESYAGVPMKIPSQKVISEE